jgi:leucyl/phenylalanyl-tRNA---protein transferase
VNLPDLPWIPPELADPDGLVGVGGDLHAATLLAAYSAGVFPWFSDDDPVLWWSPDPRAVIELDGLHVSQSLARKLKAGQFRVTLNHCFDDVVRECGLRRDGGTWITPGMQAAYADLHARGHAHSVEIWYGDELAGGIYGVTIGAFFAGESMFHRQTDGSKIALAMLVRHLKERGFQLFDVQMRTDHTTRMGAIEITRKEYLTRLYVAIEEREVTFI